jgi:hypothetical protein
MILMNGHGGHELPPPNVKLMVRTGPLVTYRSIVIVFKLGRND